MKFDVSKDNRQEEATIKWKNNKGVGCIDACPRFGKTQIGIKIINKNRHINPSSKVIVVVPSEIIEKHWQTHIPDSVLIYTSHKAKNHLSDLIKNTYDILIVDELHKFTTDDNIRLLIELSKVSKFRLALTGTYPHSNNTLKSWFPIVDTIKEEEALGKGWISEFIEYNIPIPLTKEEKVRYSKYSEKISETLSLFRGKANMINQGTNFAKDDLELIYICYSGKKHNGRYIKGEFIREAISKLMGWNRDLDLSNPDNRERDVYWNPNNLYERCKEFKRLVDNRNEIIHSCENKLTLIKYIIENNPVPTIIFNESIDFVNIIADSLGSKAIAYHSRIRSRPMVDSETGEIVKYSTGKVKMFGATRLKNEAIEGLRTGKYLYLITVKSLDEGLDVPELQQVIITSGSTNPIQQIQRSSRGKSIDSNNENKLTKIFNLYVDDYFDAFGQLVKSRDKAKLIDRQKQYDYSVKWLNSINDITL